ncbi:hypothetical protein E1301_Tti005181 [Triplophysa tibetana]|uniref:THAP-type domain-containing protein n=1 Tax=Triplophysa tibetana TaxID=1572043 RepID=A0A5A9PMK6_9TELE|nr:hypothetical protein E1301_Tti005181 [Triplophysa tibetana]
MGKSCCAIDCKNRFIKNSQLSFYRLPKAREKRCKWIAAIRRRNWNPETETWICASHFVSGKKSDDPLHPDFVPSVFSFTSMADQHRAVRNLERYLRSKDASEKKIAATALLNLGQTLASKVKVQTDEIPVSMAKTEVPDFIAETDVPVSMVKTEVPDFMAETGVPVQVYCLTGIPVTEVLVFRAETEVPGTGVQTEETQNDIASLYEQIKSLNTECQALREKMYSLENDLKRCTLDPSQFDDKKIRIFTGLPNSQTFMSLFNSVSSILPSTSNHSLKPTQELLLTLMKQRLNLSEGFLGYLFGIHQSTVSRILQRWKNVTNNTKQNDETTSQSEGQPSDDCGDMLCSL